MTNTPTLSLEEARRVLLAVQGLDHATDRAATKDDVLQAIRRMGVLQIDTINVVARSPYLVLWSRLGDYRCEWLDELLAEGALFEYWAHAACFLPIEDYPLFRRWMLEPDAPEAKALRWGLQWSQEHGEVMERVRARLRENGGVRSAEFENTTGPLGGWWNWKDEKNALESMLLTGEAMITARQNFQRVYALRERVLPGWDDAAAPPADEVRRELALRSVRALGVAAASWVADYYRQPKTGMAKRLAGLADEGRLVPAQIEGIAGPAYVHPDNLPLLDAAASAEGAPALTTLLSSFDPLTWDRQRARELFNFDYTIECYTPAAKRRYGYLNLPILRRGRLIGRLDPKAHRSRGVFEVKAAHLEEGVAVDDELAADLAGALRRLAAWHGTPEVVVAQSDPPELSAALQRALA